MFLSRVPKAMLSEVYTGSEIQHELKDKKGLLESCCNNLCVKNDVKKWVIKILITRLNLVFRGKEV